MAPAASIILFLWTDIIVPMASLTLLMECIEPFDDHLPLLLLVLSFMAFTAGVRVGVIIRVGVVTVDAGQPVSPDRRVALMIE